MLRKWERSKSVHMKAELRYYCLTDAEPIHKKCTQIRLYKVLREFQRLCASYFPRFDGVEVFGISPRDGIAFVDQISVYLFKGKHLVPLFTTSKFTQSFQMRETTSTCCLIFVGLLGGKLRFDVDSILSNFRGSFYDHSNPWRYFSQSNILILE